MTATDLVLRQTHEAVATLTLNRPREGNAMTQPLWDALHAALARASKDDDIRVIVVTGSGSAFCAGADVARLSGFASGEAVDVPADRPDPHIPGALDLPPGFDDRWSYLARIPKPVIIALNGAAVGSGFALAMFGDIRFATPEAKLSSGFVRLGLIGEMALPWILSRIAGPHVAADVLLSGRFILGTEAEKIGLINRVFPTETFATDVQKYAAEMAAQASPSAMRTMKWQLYRGLVQNLDEAVADYYPAMAASFKTDDFRSRARALLDLLGSGKK